MSSLKKYCEKNGLDENKTFNMIVGQGGGILPQKVGRQGYIAEITDTSIICTNDKLKVKKEIPFTSFTTTVELGAAYTVVGALSDSTTTLAGVAVVTFFSTFFLGTK